MSSKGQITVPAEIREKLNLQKGDQLDFEIASFVEMLGQTDGFLLEDSGIVTRSRHFYRSSKADFGDCLIRARNLARKIESTHTFDRKAPKLEGFQLV